jgi:hypothetical protein
VILPLGHFDYYYFHFPLLQDTSLSGGYAVLGNGSFDFLPYDDHRQAAISENVRGQGMEAGPLSILHYIQNKSCILFAIPMQ